jgi:hypothetical protein
MDKTSGCFILKSDNTELEDMAVPAGLFFLQRAFEEKTPSYTIVEGSGEMMPESLYDRLFSLVDEEKKTRKTRKNRKTGGRKTKKNN